MDHDSRFVFHLFLVLFLFRGIGNDLLHNEVFVLDAGRIYPRLDVAVGRSHLHRNAGFLSFDRQTVIAPIPAQLVSPRDLHHFRPDEQIVDEHAQIFVSRQVPGKSQRGNGVDF